jgi:hypothetical protein
MFCRQWVTAAPDAMQWWNFLSTAQRLPRVAANGAPRRARRRLPWSRLVAEHPVGLFADGPRLCRS